MPFASGHLLYRIETAIFAAIRRAHRLIIDDGCCRGRPSNGPLAQLFSQRVVQAHPASIFDALPIHATGGFPQAELAGNIPPLSTGSNPVRNRVHRQSPNGPGTTQVIFFEEQFLD